MIINNVTKVQATNTILANNSANTVTVDCNNVHWANNDASLAFAKFPNLTTVKNIGNTVTEIGGMFYQCYNLVNAPTIPSSVVNTYTVPVSSSYKAWSLRTRARFGTTLTNVIYSTVDLEDSWSYYFYKGEIKYLNSTTNEMVNVSNMPVSVQRNTSSLNISYNFNITNDMSGRSNIYIGERNTDADISGGGPVLMNYGTFEYCTNLVNPPVIENGLTDMSYMFNICTNLSSIPVIPNSVTTLDETFRACVNLTNLASATIPDSVTSMNNTFVSCSNLTTAPTLPNSITTLSGTFVMCYNLMNVVIPNSVTNLDSTFSTCSSLEDITIPSNVTSMNSTFLACHNLVNVSPLPDIVIHMFNTFSSCNCLVNAPALPNSVINTHSTFSSCTNLTLPADYSLENTSITDAGYMFYNCTNLTNVPALPASITRIDGMFSGCTNITTAPNIPATVTNMWRTFMNCVNLTGDIFIQSENVTTASNCFNNTSEIKNVYIPIQNNGVDTATYNAFVNAGYSTSTRQNGVLLFNIANYVPPTPPTPSGKPVDLAGYTYVIDEDNQAILTGLEMADKSNITVPNIDEE